MKINLIGGGFTHAYSSTWWKKSQNIEWIKDNSASISCYVDHAIAQGLNDTSKKLKFAWWNESPYIVDLKSFLLPNYTKICQQYELIFTYDQALIKANPKKFKFVHPVGYWIETPVLPLKTKLISMIASNKNSTLGHRKRLGVVNKYKDRLDLFGRGFKEISKKEEGLNEYMFSIVVENGVFDDYFSEKILDCFATGTIPIYWGTKNIGKYFDENGIITLTENFDFSQLTSELYQSKIESVNKNLEATKKYDIPEDILYQKYLHNYE